MSKKCFPSKWKDAGPLERKFMDLRQGKNKGPELYDQNRTNWLRGRQYVQCAETAELWCQPPNTISEISNATQGNDRADSEHDIAAYPI